MKKLTALVIGMSVGTHVFAELQALDDAEMSVQSGAGLGFALQDFVFNTDDASLAVTGIEDGGGNEVGIKWDEFYIMGEGSENGTVEKPIDIGSYLNPWVIRSVRGSSDWSGDPADYYTGDAPAIGDDVAALQILTDVYTSAAQNTRQYVMDCIFAASADCADRAAIRREGADIGSRFTLDFVDGTSHVWNIDMQGAYLDGSSFWLWSRQDQNGESELLGQLNLSLFAEKFQIDTCGDACTGTDALLQIDQLYLGLNLGFGDVQPLKFSATSDGNFVLELSKPNPSSQGVDPTNSDEMLEFFNDYYANAPKSNIYIGEITVGNRTAGETVVNGFRAQYLKATSIDL
jgi:hypothetical protein